MNIIKKTQKNIFNFSKKKKNILFNYKGVKKNKEFIKIISPKKNKNKTKQIKINNK